jgi:ATP-binding cassette subfamily C protein
MLVISLLELAQIGLLYPVIAAMTDAAAIKNIPVIGPLMESTSVSSTTEMLLLLLGMIVVVSAAKLAANILAAYLQSKLLSHGAARLGQEIYRIYLYAPIHAHVQRDSAEMLRNIRAVGPNIFSLSIPGLLGIVQGVLSALLITALVLFLNPLVVVAAASFIAALVIVQQSINGRMFRRIGEERLDLTRRVNSLVYLSFHAIKETQLLHLQDFFCRRFNVYSAAELENTRQFQFHGLMPGILNDGILTICITLVFAVSILTVNSQSLLPLLAVLFGAAYRYLPAANRIAVGFNNLRAGAPSVETYLKETRALKAHLPAHNLQNVLPAVFDHSIAFEHVTYQHPEAPGPSVSELTFSVRKGEMIGVVGASGAGKTTLANLLLGLYQPQSGRILVDGVDIVGNPFAWQKCLGYVPQQVVVADDSARRNVAFGVEDADIDDSRVIAALTDAQLINRIQREPDGLDVRLGERGAKLSGGEIQRIGIARALYRGARVLILDEATSALDTTTEVAITELIKTLSQNITIIVIAHRLSTLRNVDRLLFLKGGRLIEEGTFEQISKVNDEFRILLRSAEFVMATPSVDRADQEAKTAV